MQVVKDREDQLALQVHEYKKKINRCQQHALALEEIITSKEAQHLKVRNLISTRFNTRLKFIYISIQSLCRLSLR